MPDPWPTGRRPSRAGRSARSLPSGVWRSSRLGAFVPDEPARRRPASRAPRDGYARPAGPRPRADRPRRRQAAPWWERLSADAAAELERRRTLRRDARRRARPRLRRVRASAPRPVGLLVWWGEQAVVFRRTAGAAMALFVAAVVVLALPVLHLQRVTVTGAGGLSRGTVLGASGLTQGESMLFVRAGPAERGVLRLPGVRAARVRVLLPDRVVIALQLWTPVLVDVRAGLAAPIAPTGAALAAGRPLASLAPQLARLPRVVELGRATPVRAGAPVMEARYAQALAALVAVFPRAYGVAVREVAISGAGSLLVYTSAGWVADLGPVLTPAQLRGLAPRLEALRTLATRVDLTRPGIAAIDLQDPAQVDVTDGRPAAVPAGGPPVLRASPARA
ncbi:MAG TPA: FtsQ-type POTRA domain-containing protein [Verrucomicrobiae bacterium]|nr:FtsQ-type POTRA domain-containing protein [Verrucomicrobiae bacterium]